MKKIFISAIALALSVMVMATETAYVEITLTGASGGASTVSLTEDNARTNAYEAGYDVTSMMSFANSKSVLIYGLVGTDSCETVAAKSLEGLHIGFATNMVDDHYTLSFSNWSGRSMTLYDLVTSTTISINGTTPNYNFTVSGSQVGRKRISDRFVIDYTPAVDLGNLEVCYTDNVLRITNNPYAANIIIRKNFGDKSVAKTVIPTATPQDIDLSALAAGQYVVEFDSGARKFYVTKE